MAENTQVSAAFEAALNDYLASNWESVVADIAALVAVPGVEDLPAAAPGAPFGPEPARALDEALALAERLGFAPANLEGYVGYADLPAGEGAAADDTPAVAPDVAPGTGPAPRPQVGIIGHVDVVGAGPGWDFDPFALSRKEGYLVGRGVIDDKGPLVVAMHAARFAQAWGKAHPEDALPFDIRVIIGANEETGMADVEYYLAHEAQPDFLFTPDAEFPVGYGEKGIYHATLVSAPIADGGFEALEGGTAVNAVPGEAQAVVRGVGEVQASGKTAHASTPDEGESAIIKLISALLAEPYVAALTFEERSFLAMDAALTCAFDGSGAGVACEDEDFGPLTLVGGVIGLEPAPEAGEGAYRITQSIDIRYPTTITADELTEALSDAIACAGGSLRVGRVEEPYLTSANSPEVQALLRAYRHVTGDAEHDAFTMGGGTYARKFARAASFGVEMPWEELPAWAGSMHAANEAVSEAQLQTAFKVYAHALRNLGKVFAGE